MALVPIYIGIPLVSYTILFAFHLFLCVLIKRFILADNRHIGALGITGAIFSVCSMTIIPGLTSATANIYTLNTAKILFDAQANANIINIMADLLYANTIYSLVSAGVWYIYIIAAALFMLACAFCWSYKHLSAIQTQKISEESIDILIGDIEDCVPEPKGDVQNVR